MYVSAASGSVVQYDWDGSIWDGAGYSGISGCFRAGAGSFHTGTFRVLMEAPQESCLFEKDADEKRMSCQRDQGNDTASDL